MLGYQASHTQSDVRTEILYADIAVDITILVELYIIFVKFGRDAIQNVSALGRPPRI